MEDLTEKFIEEANDLLEKLEESLLELEEKPEDETRINEAFRVMHSLKGTGAMFGFDELSSLTHEMENVYDLVRSHKIKVTKELLDKTFNSIDLIKLLLYHADDEQVLKDKETFILDIKRRFLPESQGKGPNLHTVSDKRLSLPKEKSEVSYFIHFQPCEGVLKDGTHPIYLIDELLDLGNGKAFLHLDHLPGFEKIIPELAYLYWDFLLATDVGKNSIKDVFIFVEDNSLVEIRKIADFNLISQKGFEEVARNLELEKSIDNDKLEQLVALLKDDKTEKVPEPKPLFKQSGYEPDKPPETKPAKIGKVNLTDEMHTVRVSSEKLDKMLNLISEMITTQARLEHLSRNLQHPELKLITETYEKLSQQLRDNTLEMRLIPIYTLLTRFRRLVRDLSVELNKDVRLETKGTETELDKTLIEKLYDPLMHIIRNSMDHGFESREERLGAGKKPEGLLEISTYYSGTNVVIEISDDGRGIDPEKIRLKAIENNLVRTSDFLSEKELLKLIFKPGFTTSQKVSNVSGRGVGMDVVKKNIAELRGDVVVMSEKGKGTTVRIILPLTLSIIDGLLVYISKTRYLVPIENISHIFDLNGEEIREQFNKVIIKEGRQIPYVNLIEEFGRGDVDFQHGYLLVIKFEDREMGFIISAVVGKYQAVIKPLNKFIRGQELFLGATVLGDGEVALVLNSYKIIQKFTFK